jgi:hypothetical protein
MRGQHLIAWVILLASTLPGKAEPPGKPVLRVDPLLIAQAAEVWGVIARPDNPIWPGWNAADTPLLFYLPGTQDVLINHPKPPEGFRRYTGPVGLAGAEIFIRDGRTFFEFDGQNTALEVAGVPTLVVADTLSNRRQQVQGWLSDPTPAAQKSAHLGWDQLQSNPYDSLCMIAHEAFHAYQAKAAPNKKGSELAVMRYPATAAANTLGFALEGKALSAALRGNPAQARRQALLWLAARQERRRNLSAEAVGYEDYIEYLEGSAKYVEYRLLQVLEGRTPKPAMAWVQGFHGYGDLKGERERLIAQMEKHMAGEANVNNDPYGASPRMRLYFSGMAVGVLLDQVSPGWHGKLLSPQASLTGLAAEAIAATPAELARALEEVKNQPGYGELAAKKARLEKEAQSAADRLVEETLNGPKTTLVIDYSAIPDGKAGFAFTPFGVLRVDDRRTLLRLIPVSARVAGTTLKQTAAMPVLHDREKKQIACQLQELLPRAKAMELLGLRDGDAETVEIKGIELPGVRMDGGKGRVSIGERKIEIRLGP